LYWCAQSPAGRRYRGPAQPLHRRQQGVISSERALILAPGGRDGAVAATLLRDAGRDADSVTNVTELLEGLEQGAGLAVIVGEALQYADLTPLKQWIDAQPTWSDFPFVILTRRGAPEQALPTAQLQAALGNIILVERPFHPTAL